MRGPLCPKFPTLHRYIYLLNMLARPLAQVLNSNGTTRNRATKREFPFRSGQLPNCIDSGFVLRRP